MRYSPIHLITPSRHSYSLISPKSRHFPDAIIPFLQGPVAQLVEQRIENPRVTGSIPVQATIFKALAAKNSQILSYLGSACVCLNAHF
jgi:hypothetical protein